MANTAISGLTASATNLAAADVLPVVQTIGVGPVKMTGQQLAGGLLGSTTLSGASAITADAPVLNLTQTWNNAAVTFTGIKFDATSTASAAASLLMDLQVGGASVFRFGKDGNSYVLGGGNKGFYGYGVSTNGGYAINGSAVIVAENGRFSTSASIRFGSTAAQFQWNDDLFLTRRAAANLNLGEADTGTTSATVTITIAVPGVVTWASHGLTTGSPVSFTTTGALPTGIVSGTIYYAVVVTTSTIQLASSSANAVAATPTVITTTGTQSGVHTGARNAITQRLSVQGVTGVTDRPGADMLITGSQGTGTGAGGSIVFRVATAGSSGSAQNALATALTIDGGSAFLTTNAFSITNTISTLRAFSSGSGGGIVFANSGANSEVGIVAGNTMQFTVGGNGVTYVSQLSIGVMTGYRPTADTLLVRDLAATLALRNANNGQTFRVYGRFTDITNDFERFFITAPTTSGAAVQLGTQKGATTGAARALELQTDGTTRLTIAATGLVTVATSLTVAGGIIRTNYINSSDDQISWFHGNNTTNGTLVFADAKNNSRFQFGGTTSSFPAIKRSTTTLQARLADDSAFTNIQGKLTTDTAYTAGAVVVTGYLTLYDSTGTAYRVPCLV